jgi:hypothetical protein
MSRCSVQRSDLRWRRFGLGLLRCWPRGPVYCGGAEAGITLAKSRIKAALGSSVKPRQRTSPPVDSATRRSKSSLTTPPGPVGSPTSSIASRRCSLTLRSITSARRPCLGSRPSRSSTSSRSSATSTNRSRRSSSRPATSTRLPTTRRSTDSAGCAGHQRHTAPITYTSRLIATSSIAACGSVIACAKTTAYTAAKSSFIERHSY